MIPIPGSQAQRKNARHLSDSNAATVLDQRMVSVGDLKKAIKDLLEDEAMRETYGKNIEHLLPTDVTETLVRHVVEKCK